MKSARERLLPNVWAEGAAVALAALPLLLLMDAYVRDSPEPHNDELIYERMADAPFDPHTIPFAYRVGVPALVHVLPFSHDTSFALLAWLSTVACGGVAYVLMRRFGIGRGLAAGLGISLALCPPLFVVSLREGRNIDPESILVMLAGAIAIVDRRPRALALIVFAGVFIREAALFLIPFGYAVWAERPWDREAARDMAGPFLAGAAVFVALRLTVTAVARDRVIGYGPIVSDRWKVIETIFEGPATHLRRIVLAYGPLWIAAPFALRDLQFARRGLVLVACCLVATTFAPDPGRMILFAAPVFYVAGAWTLRDRPRLAALAVAAFLAMNVGYAVYMEDFDGAQNGIVNPDPAAYPLR